MEQLARWWNEAPQEARWLLLRQVLDERSKASAEISFDELRLAIYLAEAEAGEIEQS